MTVRRSFLKKSAGIACSIALPSIVGQTARAATSTAAEKPDLSAVTVSTPSGKVRGLKSGAVLSFKGIPYAKPPIGSLRFRPSEAALPWRGELDAFTFGNGPIQPVRVFPSNGKTLFGNAPLDEDCLTVNVWRPEAPGPHPVFVWIYGGSNISGTSSQPVYDGTAFAKANVVCVTLNYRVGALGYLELGRLLGQDFYGSGNNAQRDQILALQWVQRHIASFGGDPSRVTIAGESAGAKSVCTLLAMPASRGLFQSAIVESGGGLTVHDIDSANEVASLYLSKLRTLGVTASSLQSAPSRTLLQTQNETVLAYSRAFAFRSVVDKAFLPEVPLDAIKKGAARDVRLLIGTNRDEAIAFFPMNLVEEGRRNANATAPFASNQLAQLTPAQMSIADEKYKDRFPQKSAFERRIALLTDEEYRIPSIRVADAHARAGGDTWSYLFVRPLDRGPYANYVPHGSELPLVWNNYSDPFTQMYYSAENPPVNVGRAFHEAWVAFVHGEAPKSSVLPTWPQYKVGTDTTDSTPGMRETMLISDNAVLAQDPYGEERKLWDGLL
jgi:para-nitrobenzyl esterase